MSDLITSGMLAENVGVNSSDFQIVNVAQKQNKDAQVNRKKKADELYGQLISVNRGKGMGGNNYPKQFEDVCLDIIKLIFEDEFVDPPINKQTHIKSFNGKDYQITDIEVGVTRQRNDAGNLWSDYCHELGEQLSRIVFECKNYNYSISDMEVYQLFSYLGMSSKFGVLLVRNSCDNYSVLDGRGINTKAYEALRKINNLGSGRHMIFVFGEKEIKSLLDAYVTGSVIKFFHLQKLLFTRTFK